MRTNAGANWQADTMGQTTGSGIGTGAFAPANYIAVTENATSPSASDTTLTSELATDGLSRAQGAYSHTSNATSYTVSKTFTATGSRVIAKAALFNASSTGTMAFESLVSPTASVANGDQLTVTFTIAM